MPFDMGRAISAPPIEHLAANERLPRAGQIGANLNSRNTQDRFGLITTLCADFPGARRLGVQPFDVRCHDKITARIFIERNIHVEGAPFPPMGNSKGARQTRF